MTTMNIPEKLLEKLACPACKQKLRYQEKNNRLVCDNCLLAYPIVDEIPVLLVSEAEKIK